MEIGVEVVSRNTIKPVSPTPKHLHHYKLSFLDQISPPVYNPLVLFYSNHDSIEQNGEKLDRLKKSLSDVLTLFYPLAGRAKNDIFIECNDQGVPFLEARVHCRVSEIIQNPVPSELQKLVPFDLSDMTELPFGVQFNIFECGAVAVGLCISHKIADGLSFFTFIKSWAATARGESNVQSPQFISASLFPARDISGFEASTGIIKDNIVTKRFVFTSSMIAALRENSTSFEENQRRPSRVEALSAFIWSRFIATTQVESDIKRVNTVVHAVNLRTRIDPPLPEHSFGNLYRIAITVPSVNSEEDQSRCFVKQVRDSISKIGTDYVKKLQEGNQHLDLIMRRVEKFAKGEIVSFGFTSLCRFPLYEADFSWGKPLWVGSTQLTFKNLVVFIDTKDGDGIETYISLKVEDMAKFERDGVFQEFMSQK